MGIFSSAAAFFGIGADSGRNGNDGDNGEPAPKPTILVIDDDASFLEVAQQVLGGAGYGVLAASNGPKGLDLLRYCPHDVGVVLLDFNMPRFSGVETLEYVRKLNGQVKVIGMSGFKVDELPEHFRTSVQGFVCKPFSNGQLLEAVENALRSNSEAVPAASVSP